MNSIVITVPGSWPQHPRSFNGNIISWHGRCLVSPAAHVNRTLGARRDSLIVRFPRHTAPPDSCRKYASHFQEQSTPCTMALQSCRTVRKNWKATWRPLLGPFGDSWLVCVSTISPRSLEAPCRLRMSYFLGLSVESAVPYMLYDT